MIAQWFVHFQMGQLIPLFGVDPVNFLNFFALVSLLDNHCYIKQNFIGSL